MTITSTALISEADYCAIDDALQATEKGRRFLRAYVERNRSLESLRLLRSISRLHKAALGTPGLNAEVSRDLTSLLKHVARQRQRASECDSDQIRCDLLNSSLEEIEACLITLIESLEERAFEAIHEGRVGSKFEGVSDFASNDRTEKLFGELSSFFSTEQR